jgi:hypothetical protein
MVVVHTQYPYGWRRYHTHKSFLVLTRLDGRGFLTSATQPASRKAPSECSIRQGLGTYRLK